MWCLPLSLLWTRLCNCSKCEHELDYRTQLWKIDCKIQIDFKSLTRIFLKNMVLILLNFLGKFYSIFIYVCSHRFKHDKTTLMHHIEGFLTYQKCNGKHHSLRDLGVTNKQNKLAFLNIRFVCLVLALTQVWTILAIVPNLNKTLIVIELF